VDGPVVRAVGLTSFYGRQRGVHTLDLDARPGEPVSDRRPNGAGTTTTIRPLLDAIRPTRGSASAIRPFVVRAAAFERRDVHA
jgi:ABC-2 type transport system ATP-binding protein